MGTEASLLAVLLLLSSTFRGCRADCPCVAGEFCDASSDPPSCSPCPTGRYSSSDAAACTQCGLGKYADTTGSVNCKTCNGPGGTQCNPCAAGKYWTSSYCNSCSAAKYTGSEGKTTCRSCAQNEVANGARTACEYCAPGWYRSDTYCTRCPSGKYKDSAILQGCEDCPEFQVQDTSRTSCLDCEPGKYFTLDKCQPCPVGTYKTEGHTDATACAECPAGKTGSLLPETSSDAMWVQQAPSENNLNRVSLRSCTCSQDCVPGRYAEPGGEVCQLCPIGTYNAEFGSTACLNCTEGTNSDTLGAQSCDGCRSGEYGSPGSCMSCAPGKYSLDSATVCTDCQIGKYSELSGRSQCLDCPEGRWATPTGQSECNGCGFGSNSTENGCVPCPLGQITSCSDGTCPCESCPPGTFPSADRSNCTECAPGRYSDGSSDSLLECLECPPAKYSAAANATTCEWCPKGMDTPIELVQVGQSACSRCERGRYKVTGKKSIAFCQDCPSGRFQNSTGATRCENCVGGSYGSEAGLAECLPCPAATFSEGNGDVPILACQFCPPGHEQLVSKTGCIACMSSMYLDEETKACAACPAGRFGPESAQTICAECNAGKYQPEVGATFCLSCNETLLEYSRGGQTNCSICSDGEVQPGGVACVKLDPTQGDPCLEGMVSDTGYDPCQNCSANSYQDVWQSTHCVDCDPGRFSSSGSSVCEICAVGRFRPESQEECELCQPGYYADGGAELCEECERGSYSLEGFQRCLLCPKGKYQPNSAQSECLNCTAGTSFRTGSSEGQASEEACRDCDPGFFSLNGAEQCESCSTANGYQPLAAQTSCLPCDYGATTTPEEAVVKEHCICGIGSYGNPSRGTRCVECEAGTNCNEYGLTVPIAAPGFWVDPLNERVVIPCTPYSACLEGTKEEPVRCDTGYIGRACGECDQGYFRLEMHCRECPASDKSWMAIAIVVMFVVTAMVGFILFRKLKSVEIRHISGGFLNVALNFSQTLAVVVNFNLAFPDIVVNIMHQFNMFSFNIEVLHPECQIDFGYEDKWWLTVMLPFLLFGLLLIVWSFIRLHELIFNSKPKLYAAVGMGITRAMLMFMSISFLRLSSVSIEIFDCSQVADGSRFLDASPQTLCSFDDQVYTRLFAGAFIFTLVYAIGIPATFGYCLYHFRNRLGESAVYGRFRFLYERYEVEWFWWELVIMLRKISLVCANIFLSQFPVWQATIGLLVVFLSYTLHLFARPFGSTNIDRFEGITLVCELFLLTSGVLFYFNSNYRSETGEKFMSQSQYDTLSVLNISFTAMTFLSMFVLLSLDLRNKTTHRDERKKRFLDTYAKAEAELKKQEDEIAEKRAELMTKRREERRKKRAEKKKGKKEEEEGDTQAKTQEKPDDAENEVKAESVLERAKQRRAAKANERLKATLQAQESERKDAKKEDTKKEDIKKEGTKKEDTKSPQEKKGEGRRSIQGQSQGQGSGQRNSTPKSGLFRMFENTYLEVKAQLEKESVSSRKTPATILFEEAKKEKVPKAEWDKFIRGHLAA